MIPVRSVWMPPRINTKRRIGLALLWAMALYGSVLIAYDLVRLVVWEMGL